MSPPTGSSRRITRALPALLILFAVAVSHDAQDTGRREAQAILVETPPQIDGRLTDEVWQLGIPIGELIQVEPHEGAVPSEASEIRVLYDADYVYIGLRFYDSEPDKIVATTRERDARLEGDDRFELVIDTFLDRRNAFFFQMNATGSKGDALISNNGQVFNKPWDGIWQGKSRIDEQGWTAEVAIPFKTLSFKQNLETWGFNIERRIGRRNEDARWTGADQDVRLFAISEAGNVHGFKNIQQGVGLDVVPFFVTNRENDREAGSKTLEGDPGLDAFYKLTPNLTLSLTVNTDFAEVEVDERQINLTRFPLFFPERRDFFLQDAGNFEFADLNRRGGVDLLPFFSRTIGLTDGEEVPILAGAKLTGRARDYNIGVLDVQIDEFEDQDSENLFVSRVSRNVGEQSTIGGIFTRGDPSIEQENYLYGFDANFRTTTFNDDKTLQASLWLLDTDTEDVSGDDAAFGASLNYPNNIWRWNLRFQEIQEAFNPGLGFVRRSDIKRYEGGITYQPRVNDTIRNLEFAVDTEAVFDTDDVLETWATEIQPFGLEFQSGDRGQVEVRLIHDELREDFDISDGIIIPEGEYDWTRFALEFQSADKRPVFVELEYGWGEFFDGNRTDYEAALGWQPGPLFRGSLEHEWNDVALEGGDFDTKLARLRASFSFTPELSWSNFVQWDNVSETFGVNSRLRWIPTPGHEMFLVFNETIDENDSSLVPIFQELAFKVSYTFRF